MSSGPGRPATAAKVGARTTVGPAPIAPVAPALRAVQPRQRMLELQRDAGNKAVAAGLGIARDIVHNISEITFALGDLKMLIPFDLWFQLQLGLLNAFADLDVAKTHFETEAIKADTEKLNKEVAEMRAANDRAADHLQGHPGSRGHEKAMVLAFLASGRSGDMDLTDEIFFMRHPERNGQKLDPAKAADGQYISEWVRIRTSVVRPTLGSPLARLISTGLPKAGGGNGAKGSTPAAATP